MLVVWGPPSEHQVALDVDGSSYGNPGRAGYGGLIRDHTGSWLLGFSGHIDFADSLEAELLAILNGLMVAWNSGYKNVSCRSDCMKALCLIQDSTSLPQKYTYIVNTTKEYISRDWTITFYHTYREGNQCADFMAKLGANCMNRLGIFTEPPHGLYSLLLSDSMRTIYTRE